MRFKKLALKLKKQVVEIHFESGDVALIDREDLQFFASMHWYVIQGRGQSKYLKANIKTGDKRSTIEFHRALLKSVNGLEIDHINHNGLDNRKANLRLVTHRENQCNQPKKINATSKYFGVSFNKEKQSWSAHINANNTACGRKNLGYFPTELDAARYRELLLDQSPEVYSGKRNNL